MERTKHELRRAVDLILHVVIAVEDDEEIVALTANKQCNSMFLRAVDGLNFIRDDASRVRVDLRLLDDSHVYDLVFPRLFDDADDALNVRVRHVRLSIADARGRDQQMYVAAVGVVIPPVATFGVHRGRRQVASGWQRHLDRRTGDECWPSHDDRRRRREAAERCERCNRKNATPAITTVTPARNMSRMAIDA